MALKSQIVVTAFSDSQQQFIAAAEAAGATTPATARTTGQLPRLSARELVELLDSGLVREAADGAYYVYRRTRSAPLMTPMPASPPLSDRRVKKLVMLLIIIVMLLLPLIIRLSGRGQ